MSSDAPLTERQVEIIRHLEDHHSLKEIAHLTGMSESNLNKQISQLKRRFGARNHREIIFAYHAFAGDDGGRNSAGRFSHLKSSDQSEADALSNEAGLLHFADAGPIGGQPWQNVFEPRIVPRWLDGEHYVLARLGVIAGLLILMLALPVLGAAALDSIDEILRTDP